MNMSSRKVVMQGMSRVMTYDSRSPQLLARVVAAGGLAVIPTDTVYGIVCDPCNDAAIDRLFQAKHRPRTKSIQVLLDGVETMDRLDLSLPAPLDRLADALLPGPFSPIALVGRSCPLRTPRMEPDGPTQAVRVPDSPICRALLQVTGPLAASSANRSGNPSVETARQARAELGDSVDLYLDGGPTPGSVASTVVEADKADPDGIHVLRQGVIGEARVRALLSGRSSGGEGQ